MNKKLKLLAIEMKMRKKSTSTIVTNQKRFIAGEKRYLNWLCIWSIAVVLAICLGYTLFHYGHESNKRAIERNKLTDDNRFDVSKFDSLVEANFNRKDFSDTVDDIMTGMFITNIYDINLLDNSFKATFWVWYNYADKEWQKYIEAGLIDVFDAREVNKRMSYTLTSNKEPDHFDKKLIRKNNWTWVLFDVTLVKNWNVVNFPFDRHTLIIEVEGAFDDIKGIKFIADKKNSKFEHRLTYDDWKPDTTSFKVGSCINRYESSFGDEFLPNLVSLYPSIRAQIEIERERPKFLYFKIFGGLFTGYLICMLGFLVTVDSVARFSLHVAGVITAITNKLNVDRIIPQHVHLTLSDYTHLICFTGMFFAALISSRQLKILRQNSIVNIDKELAHDHFRNNTYLFWFFIITTAAFIFGVYCFMTTFKYLELIR